MLNQTIKDQKHNIQNDDDHKNEDNLRNEDNLKNEDDLENKDNLKKEDDLKTEDNIKNEDNLKIGFRSSLFSEYIFMVVFMIQIIIFGGSS